MQELETVWADLEPWLAEREAVRQKAVKSFFTGIAAGFAFGLVVGLLIVSFGGEWPLMGLAVVAGGVLGGLIRHGGLSQLHSEIKTGLNTRLAEEFSMQYSEQVVNAPRFDAFRDHDLLPNSDRKSFEDHFSGETHGADFELYEAHLEQRRRTKKRTYYVTVFRGVLIRISFPRTIDGVTLVTRDQGWFNGLTGWANKTFGKAGRKLERIGLVDPDFEKLFEVYGTDQVMARYLLTPSFMERLLELETLLKGKNVRCVFDDALSEEEGKGELLIVAETGNKFEPGSMFEPLDDREPVETLYGEIRLIDQIIQTVLEPATQR